jgi:feruloyl-CoA synthase
MVVSPKDELSWVADPFRTRFERRSDGALLLQPQGSLPAYPPRFMDFLKQWATRASLRTAVARRVAGGEWQRVSYGELLERVRRVAAGLVTRNLSAQRPILILSGNSIEHLVLAYAAMWAGIPYCPMSPSYSLASSDLGKARHIVELLTPGMIAAFDTPCFERVLTQLDLREVEIVGDAPVAGRAVTSLQALEASVTRELDIRHRSTGADTILRFLLTSGSTGLPKVVITTNRTVCSNAMMQRQAMPFFADQAPVLVDWLPWNHIFGGSHNVGLVLSNGGTLYIDDGRPTPAGMGETLRNLREISPTVYFNVPKGFEMLAQCLPADDHLRGSFYRWLRAYFFAGASLGQHTWNVLDAMSMRERGVKVPMLSGLGATETGPAVTFTTPAMGRSGVVGLPVKGSMVKLVAVEEKLEIRVRSPSVTPGYWREPALTAAAFDDEGFYRLGDAVRLIDERDPTRGLIFDGRISEDFKLSNGSWVSVGPLRADLIGALAPFAQDVVIAGHDADYLAALIVPDATACAQVQSDVLLGELQSRLRMHAERNAASTRSIRRAVLLPTPPSLDHGEITDKGSINQRAVLRYRADLVAALYAPAPVEYVIVIDER